MSNRARELANDRLCRDIDDAILRAVGEMMYHRDIADTAVAIRSRRFDIRNSVVAALKRNWRVSERQRGERSV